MLSYSLLGEDYNHSVCKKSISNSYHVMVHYVWANELPLLDQDCQKFADNSTLILNYQHDLIH